MSAREFRSLQFNHISWKISQLGESVLLLESREVTIEQIHSSTHLAKSVLGDRLLDIVPSYTSIAIFHQQKEQDVLDALGAASDENVPTSVKDQRVEVPICYELGLDLEEVAKNASIEPEEVIARHMAQTYNVALIGFTPGFIYMEGMDNKLACPRRSNPRKYIEAGSVGIGGSQAGIYSLDSPGGWNIVGRTPMKLFNMERQPPLAIEVGTSVVFKRITRKEFEKWGS